VAILTAAGAAVGRLHDLGFRHADLHPRNLLVDVQSAAPEVFVIDLDKGRFVAQLDEGGRRRSLVRLGRYLLRHHGKLPVRVRAADALRFLRGYCGDPSAARKLLRAVDRGLTRAWFWRRLC
jgi:tRNA A-37 threonylcarbamoyl transferase component Bud32